MQTAQPRKSSHIIAIEGFDGETEFIEADELRVCVPTRKCIQFWCTIITCFIAMAIGVFFMIFQGPTSVYFNIGEAMLAMAIGILIPGVSYGDIVKKGKKSRASLSSPTPANDNNVHPLPLRD